MIAFLGIIVFIFGCIIGSFLNVVILRYKTGRSIGGRSACFSCGTTLRAFELVPVLSFIFSFGKCRSCKSSISWQYPLVELSSGIMFVIVFWKTLLDPSLTLASLIFFWFAFSILIVISVYDLKHKIVPDAMEFAFVFASFIWLILSHNIYYFASLRGVFDLLSGLILFFPFFILWYVSDGAWIGLGDGKLSIGLGFMLGLSGGISAIIMGFWIAAGISLIIIALQRFVMRGLPYLSGKTEVPFAPFLVLGALIAFYYNLDLFQINTIFFGI